MQAITELFCADAIRCGRYEGWMDWEMAARGEVLIMAVGARRVEREA
jgi:hypothetical protein